MNSNFFNQQNKDDNSQKNPFMNPPFGTQQNQFGAQGGSGGMLGGQGQQTGVFGTQQPGGMFGSGPSTGFGGTGQLFGGQGFQGKQEPGAMGGQTQPQGSSIFGKPGGVQAGGGSSIFGGQSTLQAPTDPFKLQSAAPSGIGGVAGQQTSSPFGTQTQGQSGGVFGGQPGVAGQSANPFSTGTMQSSSLPGMSTVQPQGSPGLAGMGQAGGFGGSQWGTGTAGATGLGTPAQQGVGNSGPALSPFGGGVSMGTSGVGGQSTSPAPPMGSMGQQTGVGEGLQASPAAPPPQEQVGESKGPGLASPKERTSASVFTQPAGEKSVSFMQMTLGEIVQQQTRKLEENIKVFKEKAKEVFEQDERIIRSLNNYKLIRSRIEEEERIIAETEENVEFFERWLCSFQKEVPEGAADELLTCIKEFERICDKYNKTLETLKDEEDEVMCLVNENYNLINTIDEKLDVLEKYQ